MSDTTQETTMQDPTIERLKQRIANEFSEPDIRSYLNVRLAMFEKNVRMLPDHMREGALVYVMEGREGGHFLTAVLQNNLVKAFERADIVNSTRMLHWAQWLYNHCPMPAWGGDYEMRDWIAKGGIIGRMKAGERE